MAEHPLPFLSGNNPFVSLPRRQRTRQSALLSPGETFASEARIWAQYLFVSTVTLYLVVGAPLAAGLLVQIVAAVLSLGAGLLWIISLFQTSLFAFLWWMSSIKGRNEEEGPTKGGGGGVKPSPMPTGPTSPFQLDPR